MGFSFSARSKIHVPPGHPAKMLQCEGTHVRETGQRIVLGRRALVLMPHCMSISRNIPCPSQELKALCVSDGSCHCNSTGAGVRRFKPEK